MKCQIRLLCIATILSLIMVAIIGTVVSANVLDKEYLNMLKLKQGYTLRLVSIDVKAEPKHILLELDHNGKKVGDKIISQGDTFEMYDRDALILSAKFNQVFMGVSSYMIQLKDLSQYNGQNGKLMLYIERAMLEIKY